MDRVSYREEIAEGVERRHLQQLMNLVAHDGITAPHVRYDAQKENYIIEFPALLDLSSLEKPREPDYYDDIFRLIEDKKIGTAIERTEPNSSTFHSKAITVIPNIIMNIKLREAIEERMRVSASSQHDITYAQRHTMADRLRRLAQRNGSPIRVDTRDGIDENAETIIEYYGNWAENMHAISKMAGALDKAGLLDRLVPGRPLPTDASLYHLDQSPVLPLSIAHNLILDIARKNKAPLLVFTPPESKNVHQVIQILDKTIPQYQNRYERRCEGDAKWLTIAKERQGDIVKHYLETRYAEITGGSVRVRHDQERATYEVDTGMSQNAFNTCIANLRAEGDYRFDRLCRIVSPDNDIQFLSAVANAGSQSSVQLIPVAQPNKLINRFREMDPGFFNIFKSEQKQTAR